MSMVLSQQKLLGVRVEIARIERVVPSVLRLVASENHRIRQNVAVQESRWWWYLYLFYLAAVNVR